MILAGTGHRPNKLGGYSDDGFKRLVSLASSALDKYTGVEAVISGLALGWDQALAVAAINKKIPLWGYVPFIGQESAWPQQSREQYDLIKSQASKIYVVCDGGYAAWKMQRRNEAMCKDCDVLLALWNGTSGGTGNCIKYAQKIGKTIDNLWDQYQLLNCTPKTPPSE